MKTCLAIGVHCSHGVNRTGYFVSRFLIEQHGFDPETAIDIFKKSRGHPIDHKGIFSDSKRLAILQMLHRRCMEILSCTQAEFQTDAFKSLCDWLALSDSIFGWLRVPSRWHQLENPPHSVSPSKM